MEYDSHPAIEELIPAYALGALDGEESQVVEQHLRSCAECRRSLADYRAVGDAMLYSVPMRLAPLGLAADLRKRLTPAGVGAAVPAPPRRDWLAFLRQPAVLVGAAGLIVVLLLFSNLYFSQRVAGLEQRVAAFDQLIHAAPVVLEPALEADNGYATASPYGALYKRADSNLALLCVYNLSFLPAGQTYQVWLIHNGERESGGLFRVSSDGFGILLIEAPRPLQSYEDLGVTVEPAGGSLAPTSPRVIGGSI